MTNPANEPTDIQPQPESTGSMTPIVSKRWILLGSLAMMLGLAMGMIMSSLGR